MRRIAVLVVALTTAVACQDDRGPVAPGELQEAGRLDATTMHYDHVFHVENTDDSGPGSLRDVILRVNATAVGEISLVSFERIQGCAGGFCTIRPRSRLPTFFRSVVVDGRTHPAYAGSPVVVIDGTDQPGGVVALGFNAGDSRMLGLTVNHYSIPILWNGPDFLIAENWIGLTPDGQGLAATLMGCCSAFGILFGGHADRGIVRDNVIGLPEGAAMVDVGSGVRIVRNHLGVNAAGDAYLLRDPGDPKTGLWGGIQVKGGENVIEENVIAGVTGQAIFLVGSGGNTIRNNKIDTNADGTAPLPGGPRLPGTQRNGIQIASDDNRVEGNVIAANAFGLGFAPATGAAGPVANNVVAGNFVGVSEAGVPLVAPGFSAGFLINFEFGVDNRIEDNRICCYFFGIRIRGHLVPDPPFVPARYTITGNVIERTLRSGIEITGANQPILIEDNEIVDSGANGVRLWAGSGPTTLLRNSIHSSAGLGIDVGGDGPTPNDAGDLDTGANGLQNFPKILEAGTFGSKTRIKGELHSAPNASYTVELFSDAPEAGAFGEGETWLGRKIVHTNAAGDGRFTVVVSPGVLPGRIVTATATGAEGTSEFSRPDEVGELTCAEIDALIEDLVEDVGDLETAGVLNAGQARSLVAKLEAALGRCPSPADRVLMAFVHEVEALVQGGVVVASDGEELVDEAEAIVALLSP